jgi:magnesium-transporting ATPase (P-type)
MEFKKFSAGMQAYGTNEDMPTSELGPGITNVNFNDAKFWKQWKNEDSTNQKYLTDFVNILAICHTIIVEEKNGILTYNASSPDELALTNAARHFGIIFESRDEDANIVIYNKHLDKRFKYQLLNVIEFTSDRKRMSCIIKTPDDRIICMTKGADSIILPRLSQGQDQIIDKTMSLIYEFANEGLRTLLIAQKEIDP